MAELGFDTQGDYSTTLPNGVYTLAIVKADTPEKNGKKSLVITSKVCEGDRKGTEFQTFFSLFAESDTARRVAGQKFADLCKVIGLSGKVNDTSELLNKVYKADVIITPSKTDSSMKFNNVRKYYSLGEAIPVAAAAAEGDALWD